MAVTKKTIDEIAEEYKYDLSEEAAKKYADAYVQPTINEINVAEQQAIADTQAARKALENDYFKQYRANTYSAQSRGLTGGLAEMDNQLLRMQLGQANADLSKNLILAQDKAAAQRGTALSNAEAYKTNYLNDLRNKVAQLQQADYEQRYKEWQFEQQMAEAQKEFEENKRRWELEYAMSKDRYNMEKDQFEYEKSLRESNKAQSDALFEAELKEKDIQNQVYADDYAAKNLTGIYNNYANMLQRGDRNGAEAYLNSQINKLAGIGYDTSGLRNEIQNLETIRQYQNYIDNYQSKATQARWAGHLATAGWGGTTGLLALSGIGLPFALASAVAGGLQAQDAYSKADQLDAYLAQARNARNQAYLPSWYTGTNNSWYNNYLQAIGAIE